MATNRFKQAELDEGTPDSSNKAETKSLKHRIINAFDQVGIVIPIIPIYRLLCPVCRF